jgi:hypothetical protein
VERTKISSRFLCAIENEEFEKLPGGIFTTSTFDNTRRPWDTTKTPWWHDRNMNLQADFFEGSAAGRRKPAASVSLAANAGTGAALAPLLPWCHGRYSGLCRTLPSPIPISRVEKHG